MDNTFEGFQEAVEAQRNGDRGPVNTVEKSEIDALAAEATILVSEAKCVVRGLSDATFEHEYLNGALAAVERILGQCEDRMGDLEEAISVHRREADGRSDEKQRP